MTANPFQFGRVFGRVFWRACMVCAASATIISCEAPTATRPNAPYDLTALTDGFPYRWRSGSHVRVAIATANLPPTTNLSAAVKHAVDVWNAVPQYGEVTLEIVPNMSDANIIVYDQVTAVPVQLAPCQFFAGNGTGYTYFCPTFQATGGAYSAPDDVVRMNLTTGSARVSVIIRVDRARAGSATSYEAVVAHELGHALGIGAHSIRSADVMFGSPTVSTPTDVDRAALRAALGAPVGIRL